MTMPSLPTFPPGLDEEAIERAVDAANTRLMELQTTVMEALDDSHDGFMKLSPSERLARYAVMPTPEQIQACVALVAPVPEIGPDSQPMMQPQTFEGQPVLNGEEPVMEPVSKPSAYASLTPLVEELVAMPSFEGLIAVLGHVRPDRAAIFARDAASLGLKAAKGKRL